MAESCDHCGGSGSCGGGWSPACQYCLQKAGVPDIFRDKELVLCGYCMGKGCRDDYPIFHRTFDDGWPADNY